MKTFGNHGFLTGTGLARFEYQLCQPYQTYRVAFEGKVQCDELDNVGRIHHV